MPHRRRAAAFAALLAVGMCTAAWSATPARGDVELTGSWNTWSLIVLRDPTPPLRARLLATDGAGERCWETD